RQKVRSQFIIGLAAPGVTVRPIVDLTGDAHFSEVTFDDVFLPDDALVGEEGGGWEQGTSRLACERSGPERLYSSIVLVDLWVQALRAGQPSDADAANAALLGSFVTQLATLRRLSGAVAARRKPGGGSGAGQGPGHGFRAVHPGPARSRDQRRPRRGAGPRAVPHGG